MLAASIGLALSSASASVRPTPPDSILQKGRLTSDGVLTVGQPETVFVTKLPAKTKLHVFVDPGLSEQCSHVVKRGLCISAPIGPAAGAPAFRTNRKGKATLTFVVPDHYDVLDPNNLIDRHPVAFTNGEPVEIAASGGHLARRHGHREIIFGSAQSRAVVQTAQPAPAP